MNRKWPSSQLSMNSYSQCYMYFFFQHRIAFKNDFFLHACALTFFNWALILSSSRAKNFFLLNLSSVILY